MNNTHAFPDRIKALTGAQAQSSRPVIVLASIAFLVLQAMLGAALWMGVKRQGEATDRVHLYEDAKSMVLQVLRGANETVVTDGSSGAREMLVVALKKLDSANYSGEFKRAAISTKIDWPALNQRFSAFAARENVGTSDVDSLVELGRLSRDAGNLVDWLDHAADGVVAEAGRARLMLYGILGASIITIFLGTLGYFLTFHQRVTRPLMRAVTLSERLSTGNLTPIGNAELANSGEATALMAALARVTDNLNRLVTGVRDEVEYVRIDSRQVAQGNANLSKRTEQQAATLEETAAAMEQMTVTVSTTAENANEAANLATQAAGIASRGGESVRAVVATMTEIADSSKRISEIIGVIDSIAFQTNILALNAAVEAARAGEQGRGFAVVAAEVRTLAQRSATAAKEIKNLLTDSAAKVNLGTQQVGIAGSNTDEIIRAAETVRSLIEAISTASKEQLQGIKQASDAIVQLETVTQQNAAMVEASTAMTQNQADRIENLANMVAVFKTRELEPATDGISATAARYGHTASVSIHQPQAHSVAALPAARSRHAHKFRHAEPLRKASGHDTDCKVF